MRLKTMAFSPFRLATCAFIVVASFRLHNAGIALSEFLKARVAVSLCKAFLCFSIAMDAVDIPGVLKNDVFSNEFVNRFQLIAQW